MICERCKKQEATCEFRYGNQRGARLAHGICVRVAFEHFAPGFPTIEQIQNKSKETRKVTTSDPRAGRILVRMGFILTGGAETE